jgi:hypothetical protein
MTHRARNKFPALPDGVVHVSEPLAAFIEPALTMENVCAIRNESRRTGERERSAGLWPPPDFSVGTGSRKSPRWLAATIRRWLDEPARKGVAK